MIVDHQTDASISTDEGEVQSVNSFTSTYRPPRQSLMQMRTNSGSNCCCCGMSA